MLSAIAVHLTKFQHWYNSLKIKKTREETQTPGTSIDNTSVKNRQLVRLN